MAAVELHGVIDPCQSLLETTGAWHPWGLVGSIRGPSDLLLDMKVSRHPRLATSSGTPATKTPKQLESPGGYG